MKGTKAMKRSVIHVCVAAAFAAAWGTTLAADEVEPNDTAATAQPLVVGADGSAQINGVIGVVSGTPVPDVDFYSFDLQANADGSCVNVTFDIDNGIQADGTGVDTILAVFGPETNPDGTTDPLATLAEADDAPDIDPGSVSTSDARIDNLCLTESGHYVVGVSSFPRAFIDVNTLASSDVSFPNANGSYTLIVTGLPPVIQAPPPPPPPPPPTTTPPPPPPPPAVQQVSIRVWPRHMERFWDERDAKAKGTIAVAILSSATLDAVQINPQSLRFGKNGTENSFVRCDKRDPDVNHDHRRDLLCFFDMSKTGFEVGDTEGKLTGVTAGGIPVQGHGWLKVVPQQKRQGHDRDRGDRDRGGRR